VIEIRRYVTRTGKDTLGEWLAGLKDIQVRAKIAVRIARVATGNFGDSKRLSQGLYELRIDFGPGYRVYYGMLGRTCALLLCGGDKSKQSADIKRAHIYWEDYLERTGAE
jgi:putative addiction module killer protein